MNEKDRQRRADDRLALGAVLVGGAIAFLTRQDPIALGTGVSLGLAGVFLALRGDRPIAGRGWIRAALFVTLLLVAIRFGLERYEEWVVGQWFAEGHSGMATNYELRGMSRLASGLRFGGLASSLAMLVGAMVNRL